MLRKLLLLLLPVSALLLSCKGGLDVPSVGAGLGDAYASVQWLELPETFATVSFFHFVRCRQKTCRQPAAFRSAGKKLPSGGFHGVSERDDAEIMSPYVVRLRKY